MKKIIRIVITLISVSIFISCIVQEVEGIGRFAMIFSGTVFAFIPYLIKDKYN